MKQRGIQNCRWLAQGDTERNLLGRVSIGFDSTEQGAENELSIHSQAAGGCVVGWGSWKGWGTSVQTATGLSDDPGIWTS